MQETSILRILITFIILYGVIDNLLSEKRMLFKIEIIIRFIRLSTCTVALVW